MRVMVDVAGVQLVVAAPAGMTIAQLAQQATRQASKHRKLQHRLIRVVDVELAGASLDEDCDVAVILRDLEKVTAVIEEGEGATEAGAGSRGRGRGGGTAEARKAQAVTLKKSR